VQKFTTNVKKNQLIFNIGIDGIDDLDNKTKNDLKKEIDINK